MSTRPDPPHGDRGTGRRPGVCVPGLLFTEVDRERWGGRGVLRLGPEAGLFTSRVDLPSWKGRSVHLVERRRLTETIVRSAGLVLPETQIDPREVPRLHRFAREAPLVQIHQRDIAPLIERGVRVFSIGFERRADDMLRVEARGGAATSLAVVGLHHELLAAAAGPARQELDEELGMDAVEALDRTGFLDRVLRASTRGLVDEVRIGRAEALRSFVEIEHDQGAGVRPLRERLTRDQVRPSARGEEAQLQRIYEQAEAAREDAERIVEALARAAPGEDVVRVPIYGEAHRIRAPAFVIDAYELSSRDSAIRVPDEKGGVASRLVVPEEVVWCVDDVEPWSIPDAARLPI